MLTLLAALLVAAPGPLAGDPTPIPFRPIPDATIRITLNGNDFGPGDRVRVQVEPSQDGYLVVFRVDGEGRIRVLFPIDPDLDAFVRGGKRYELRGRNERETFLADDRGGNGLIYAALAHQPLSFSQYAINDHWDYDALRLRDNEVDPEVDLSSIVRRMGDNGRFDYDVASYRVHDTRVIVSSGGRSYDPYYDPYWSCLSCGWGYGRGSSIGISFSSRYNGWYGYNNPWYRDPWYYDPYAFDSYYGYYGYPYVGQGYLYPGQYRPITVVNLPRPRVPDTDYGFRARSRPPVNTAGLFAPDLSRSMRPEARPVASNGRGNTGTTDRGSYDTRGRERNNDASRARPGSSSGDRRESAPPSTSRPTTSAPPPSSGNSGSSGGNDNRARRRPELSADLTPRVFEPSVDRRQAEAPQPIFREPRRESPTVERGRPERSQERPVYREPKRTERASSPPPQSAPPRVERPTSPPPSAPAQGSSAGTDRARRRP